MKGFLALLLLTSFSPREAYTAAATYEIKDIAGLLPLSSAVVLAKVARRMAFEEAEISVLKVLFEEGRTDPPLRLGGRLKIEGPLALSDDFMTEHGVTPSAKAPTFPIYTGSGAAGKKTHGKVIIFLKFQSGWHLAASSAVLSSSALKPVTAALLLGARHSARYFKKVLASGISSEKALKLFGRVDDYGSAFPRNSYLVEEGGMLTLLFEPGGNIKSAQYTDSTGKPEFFPIKLDGR